MDPPFPARFPLEMFHCVRDVYLLAIDSSFFERSIHDFPGRSNKGFTRDVFIITRLFADQHHNCALRTFAKNRLRRALVKVTCLAIFRCLADGRPARGLGRSRRPCKLLVICSHILNMNRTSRRTRLRLRLAPGLHGLTVRTFSNTGLKSGVTNRVEAISRLNGFRFRCACHRPKGRCY